MYFSTESIWISTLKKVWSILIILYIIRIQEVSLFVFNSLPAPPPISGIPFPTKWLLHYRLINERLTYHYDNYYSDRWLTETSSHLNPPPKNYLIDWLIDWLSHELPYWLTHWWSYWLTNTLSIVESLTLLLSTCGPTWIITNAMKSKAFKSSQNNCLKHLA